MDVQGLAQLIEADAQLNFGVSSLPIGIQVDNYSNGPRRDVYTSFAQDKISPESLLPHIRQAIADFAVNVLLGDGLPVDTEDVKEATKFTRKIVVGEEVILGAIKIARPRLVEIVHQYELARGY